MVAKRAHRIRLDQLVVARGLAASPTRAQALILAGKVIVDGHRHDKSGERIREDAEVTVKGDGGWASRGAYKLLGAFEAFPWLGERVAGARCLDIGASTGGFSDVLLRRGAAAIVAVDVGYGQLDWRLRSDPRIIVFDRKNIRYMTSGDLPWAPEIATSDASFISVRLFIDVVFALLVPGGVFIVLVKPQFEVGRAQVGEGGVVRDEATRQSALGSVSEAARLAGFTVRGSADSPLAGPSGNREILLALEKPTGR